MRCYSGYSAPHVVADCDKLKIAYLFPDNRADVKVKPAIA